MWVPAEDATEVIIAEGVASSPDRKMTMMELRRKAADTRFLTVFEPVNPGDIVRAARTEKAELVTESARGTRRVAIE